MRNIKLLETRRVAKYHQQLSLSDPLAMPLMLICYRFRLRRQPLEVIIRTGVHILLLILYTL